MENQNHLKWLLYPFGKIEFLSDYFEKKPLIVKRYADNYYNDFLGIEEIQGLFELSGTLSSVDISIERGGEVVPLSSYTRFRRVGHVMIKEGVDLQKVWDLFHSLRGVISINKIQNVDGKLFDLTQVLSSQLEEIISSAVTLAHKKSQTTPLKSVTFDQFVLQIKGCRRWRIYAPAPRVETDEHTGRMLNLPMINTLLEAGDLLYIPGGFRYEREMEEKTSAELNIYMRRTSHADVLINIIDQIALEDDLFREGYIEYRKSSDPDFEKKLEIIKERIISHLTVERLRKAYSPKSFAQMSEAQSLIDG